MKRYALIPLAALALMSATQAVHAQASKKPEVIALVDKAVANIQKKGIEQACKDFADPNGGYIQGDLYVFVHDSSPGIKMVCHGTNPKLNNKDMSELRDSNGKYFTREMKDLAQSGKTGWVDYIWLNPLSKTLEPKSSYVRKADDKYWVGVGIYTRN